MFSIILDPAMLQTGDGFIAEVRRFVEFVRTSEMISPDAEILMPGEVEQRNREKRLVEGIELDEKTWSQIVDVARSLNVSHELQTTNTDCRHESV